MTQAVELLLDAESEQRVVDDWRRLVEAGLTSQAGHRSPSNRPHVTLAAVPSIDEAQEAALATLFDEHLPLTAYVGPLTVFGRDRVTLVRLVVVSGPLLDLHTPVSAVAGTARDALEAPGRWVPHVTLATRLPIEHLTRAVEVLPSGGLPVRFEQARRWDSDRRVSWTVERSGR